MTDGSFEHTFRCRYDDMLRLAPARLAPHRSPSLHDRRSHTSCT